MQIEVFTDGSATTKDKPGGFAWVIVVDGKRAARGCGWMKNATNNDAELQAAIEGLASLLKPGAPQITEQDTVILVSDSEIILKWANGTNRFKQASKMEKYEQLRWLMKRFKTHTRWVEGHSGNEFNEECDKMARAERRRAMGIEPKKKTGKSILMLQAIKEIAKIAKTHDTGQRESNMSDWDYVMKQCEKVLNL